MPSKPRDAWNLNSSIDTEISEQNDINTNSILEETHQQILENT